MQVVVLFGTIIGAMYFLLFQPDSPIAITLMALAPLSWLGLFSVRFFSEKKKKKEEGGERTKRSVGFIDPDELVKNSQAKRKENEV